VSSPRICLPTWRGFKRMAFHGALYEAEDVLAAVDDVEMLPLEPRAGLAVRERLQRRLLWHDLSRRLIHLNPGLRPVRLTRDYDLFLAICQNWWDVLYLSAIPGWKDHCRTSICYIDELWAKFVPDFRYWIHVLERFDHVVVGLEGTVTALAGAIGRPCHFVPGAVDAIRFSPYPEPAARVIDVYSIGRKYPGVHEALLGVAARQNLFYVYDTSSEAANGLVDHRQHRALLASMAKRSRCFMVGPAKMGVPQDTHGQIELGYRYFEGAAAGAVMIGQAPDCRSFRDLFGWPDAVVTLQEDGSDTEEVLTRLAKEPDRFEDISRRNASEALLRHDWVYRWRQILQIAGLTPRPALEAREACLRELATCARSSAARSRRRENG
jgi:spore maturation protein CgeB